MGKGSGCVWCVSVFPEPKLVVISILLHESLGVFASDRSLLFDKKLADACKINALRRVFRVRLDPLAFFLVDVLLR